MLLPIMLYVSIVPPNIKESLISLRDADFVGEDKRLKSLLAQRMAVLQAPPNMTGADEPSSLERFARRAARPLDDSSLLQPDFLDFKHISKTPNNVRFNVSMDYGELVNVSNLLSETPLADADALNFTDDGRRRPPLFYYATVTNVNKKILSLMKQNIYMVQGRLIDIEPLVKANEGDVRFRIAYIMSRIDEWMKDLKTINHAIQRTDRPFPGWTVRRHLYYYEHALRKNIDITYSIELVVYLHGAYMAKMKEIMPKDQLDQLAVAKDMRQKMGRLNKSAADFWKKNDTEADKQDFQPRARLPRL